ncbi:MAG: glycosyltransferase family 2 protein [Elusimicrobiales bacterium]|jgi:glycosyltransferase involved in cell wall biosynthesis
MTKISVSIIARNEEKNLAACLESLSWADEVVLVDCESTDKTAEIAARYPVKIFSRPNTSNLNLNKQFGIDQCSGEWIFYLDPDETVPDGLRDEIKALLAGAPPADAYSIPRRNYYFGRWLRHGGKYPDPQLRLFRKGKASFPCRDVHERLAVRGKEASLKHPFDHFPYRDHDDVVKKLIFYAGLKAEKFMKAGRPSALGPARALRKFAAGYFLKLGFLDGPEGFAAAVIDMFNEVLAYLKTKSS